MEEMLPTPAVFQLIADPTCPTVEKEKKIRAKSISTAEVNSCHSSIGKSAHLGEIKKEHTRSGSMKPQMPFMFVLEVLGCDSSLIIN